MKIVLLADLHLPAAGQDGQATTPARDHLRAVVGEIRAHHADAEHCILLGDLTENGLAAEYDLLGRELEALPMPWSPILGNHDDRANFLRSSLARPVGRHGADPSAGVQAIVEVGTLRCILLDSHVPGRACGLLDDDRLDWLARALASARGDCILCLHHPPLAIGVPAFDAIGLSNRQTFAAVLEPYAATVKGVYFGHCHMPVFGAVAGIPAVGIPAVARRSIPNFSDDRFIDAQVRHPGYAVIVSTTDGLATHVMACDMSA